MTAEHATPFTGASYFGRPIKRREDPRLITGQGKYIDDFRLPGMLFMAVVRSPYAHARIRTIDTRRAEAMPGVVTVVTGEQAAEFAPPYPPAQGPKQPPRLVLAREKVRKVGEGVAIVLADDRYLASDAAAAVEVDYDPLPAVVDPEAALDPDAPQLWEDFPGNVIIKDSPLGSGDVEAAFDKADVVIRQRMVCPRLSPSAIETRGFVASYQAWDEALTLWVTQQSAHGARLQLSRLLGLPESRIRVIAPEVGGGFGSKSNVYHEEAIGCFMAMRLGRPVKWIETRMEAFTGTSHGRGQVGYIELAAKRDGTVLGLKLHNIADVGHLGFNGGALGNTPRLAPNVYRFQAARMTVTEVLTNKTQIGPYRGAGRPEGVYFTERAMDMLARELGMDPAELRRKNFIPPDAFPYKTVTGLVYDSGDYGKALETLLESAGYDDLKRRRDEARAQGCLVGIGLTSFVENAGGMGWENGSVRVDRDGSVVLLSGSSSHGQGHETGYTQIACEVLGVGPELVTVLERDTAVVSQGIGTFGSRSMTLGGSAIYLSLRDVEAKMRRIAARLLETDANDLQFRNGRIEVASHPEDGVAFGQVAAHAYSAPEPGDEIGLEAQHFYSPDGTTFPFGAYLCMVEVDRETGAVTVLRFDGVDDCGTVVNPLLARGQVHGGIAQGLGQALMEEIVYDEDGQLISGGFLDYAIPAADDVPSLTIAHTVTPSPLTPLGIKGIGESGTIGSTPAIANAVIDALSPLGIRHIDIPLTAARVWQAIRESNDT
ncbi:MAG TPA: xanthine dehydrogenase family protein molybdopterin-binding subunit [Dehalococcoidia bacterium]|nr:xanthine dehydrogenase family protein molybdopterin-binding subunit [Dehalococcoidia bacterium]